ncbi:MAG: 4Fe-4S binding protein [Desulfovibrionales bacterium]
MSRAVFNEERCKGCLLCTMVCPKETIRQADRFNTQGYKVAEVAKEDSEKCIGCGFCAEVCPDYAIVVFKSKKTVEGES